MRGRVTTSIRPLSGTLTTSLSHEIWDVTASALTDTSTTPKKNKQFQTLFRTMTCVTNGALADFTAQKNAPPPRQPGG